MSDKNLMNQLTEVFRDVFEDDELTISESTTAKDVDGWDSLAHLQLIAAVEEKFGIHFTLGEIQNFANVGEMCDSVEKHLLEK